MVSRDYENLRVLIVDDQKEIHDDFVEMLTPDLAKASSDHLAGAFLASKDRTFLPEFELLHATSGEEACEIIKAAKESNRPIAVAYIDIRMPPGIDGIETVRRVRKIDRDLEIVIMTAYTDKSLPEIIHDMELLHKLLYIRKPFAREEIQQITFSLAGKWNVEQELAEKRRQLTINHQRLEAVLDATGDAMAMYDTDERLVFANRGYEKMLDLSKGELEKLSTEAFMEHFHKRFREPDLPDVERGFFIAGNGSVVQESNAGKVPQQRLFYRSTAPVHDTRGGVIGDLFVYRDVSKEIEVEKMKAEVMRLRTELEKTYSFSGMVGGSDQMKRVYALVKQAAESDITVLIRGESGTGKELVARSFHFNSLRKQGPFLAINCAAIPEALIESELFGHEKGAFTGADRQRIGAFERAKSGTVFLDEVGDMPPFLQAKLLRVLQEREIQRIGGSNSIPVDVRVIAATNKDLESRVKSGEFREDLYYRIAVFPHRGPAAAGTPGRHSSAGETFSGEARRAHRQILGRHFQRRLAAVAAVRLARQRARAGERHRARRSAGDDRGAAGAQSAPSALADRGFPARPHGAGGDPPAGGSRAAGSDPGARSLCRQRDPGGSGPGSQSRYPVPEVEEIRPARR